MIFNKIFDKLRPFYNKFCKVYKEKSIRPELFEDGFRVTYSSEFEGIKNKYGIGGLLQFYMNSRVIAAGPKIIKTSGFTNLELESLENMDLRIELEDYVQPFPTVCIELDKKNYVRECYNPIDKGMHKPDLVILDQVNKDLIVGGVVFGEDYIVNIPIYKKTGEHTIEEIVDKIISQDMWECSLATDSSEMNVANLYMKMAMNLCLLLMEVGMKKERPNQKHYDKLIKRRKFEEARTIPLILSVNQKVRLFTISKLVSSEPGKEPTHTVSPHWRRGFRRRQRYGTNNQLTKIVTIRPVFVNAQLFSGRMKDTIYEGN